MTSQLESCLIVTGLKDEKMVLRRGRRRTVIGSELTITTFSSARSDGIKAELETCSHLIRLVTCSVFGPSWMAHASSGTIDNPRRDFVLSA